ncbi:DUF2617 family protein [Streptomyces sp. NPDC052236]|uniref:DUF2617 family protein n=1 Tax=Streptomyces sp. NPDC052236 TaxID=3365686 RepID=UPI0037D2F75F
MNGTALTTPYLDTDADQLSFTLGRPAREALAVRDLTVGGLDVQLRLLGASHQRAVYEHICFLSSPECVAVRRPGRSAGMGMLGWSL